MVEESTENNLAVAPDGHKSLTIRNRKLIHRGLSQVRFRPRRMWFPSEYSIGTLFLESTNGEPSKNTEAVGEIEIPNDTLVRLRLHGNQIGYLLPLASLRSWDLHGLEFHGSRFDDSHLSYIAHLIGLNSLDLSHTGDSITDLSHIARMINLDELNLTQCAISEEALESICSLVKMKRLSLFGASSVRNLSFLRNMMGLERLDLKYTEVRDSSLVYVKDKRKLRELNLGGTMVTDQGLHYLFGLSNLRRLVLRETDVTTQGKEALQRHLPCCSIV
ncbi:MAG: hypothetical protein KF831_11555 [Acidobacteria bacterium]|nr:hypothetical protein [Acidobacteriota bacterium]